jgi:hypothetical protein
MEAARRTSAERGYVTQRKEMTNLYNINGKFEGM